MDCRRQCSLLMIDCAWTSGEKKFKLKLKVLIGEEEKKAFNEKLFQSFIDESLNLWDG